ncbi:unnamed protein product, partial [Prorocentrum cordatum]
QEVIRQSREAQAALPTLSPPLLLALLQADELLLAGLQPDVAATRAAEACGQGSAWRAAVGLLPPGRRVPLALYSGVADACDQAGQWARALGLRAEHRERARQLLC